MSDDDLSYLQPGFDLNSLTMPRLRSILVAQEVSYPPSSKKPQLVQIVTDEVLPKARKLLKAHAAIKRTSRGITDMGDGEAADDGQLMPPPPTPKTPRGRKSKSNLVADDALAPTPPTTIRSRTPGKRTGSSKHARASDTETDHDRPISTARKTRKSQGPETVTDTPRVKLEEPDRHIKRESLDKEESPFSNDNPFQSGSSPARDPRRVPSGRKSLGTTDKRKSSTSRRRQTTSPPTIKQEDGIRAPSRSTFEFPASSLGSDRAQNDELEASEEFTPEAIRELEQERTTNGPLARKGPSALTRRRRGTPTSTTMKVTPWAILTVLVATLAGWYRQEKFDVGYCGVGQPNWSLSSNSNIPQWVHEKLGPVCEPCPAHAICYPSMVVKCEDDFLKVSHPLSLFGFLPLPPTCQPDSEKSRRIKIVAERAVEELRDRRAAHECGLDVNFDRASEEEPGIDGIRTVIEGGETKLQIAEETLKQEVGKMRKKGMTAEEFEELWRGALGEIMELEEVVVVRDGSGRVFLSSTSLARLPLNCYIRRSIRGAISRNRIPLSILTVLCAALFYGWMRIVSYREATAQIPALVAITLDRLATQAALKEDGKTVEGFISVGQLRDDVLRNVFSARERERVWKGVRAVVESNSNVRASNREGARTGEFSRVWEWIGPVNLVPNFKGNRAGGFFQEVDGTPEANDGNTGRGEMVESRKWDEGRPIY